MKSGTEQNNLDAASNLLGLSKANKVEVNGSIVDKNNVKAIADFFNQGKEIAVYWFEDDKEHCLVHSFNGVRISRKDKYAATEVELDIVELQKASNTGAFVRKTDKYEDLSADVNNINPLDNNNVGSAFDKLPLEPIKTPTITENKLITTVRASGEVQDHLDQITNSTRKKAVSDLISGSSHSAKLVIGRLNEEQPEYNDVLKLVGLKDNIGTSITTYQVIEAGEKVTNSELKILVRFFENDGNTVSFFTLHDDIPTYYRGNPSFLSKLEYDMEVQENTKVFRNEWSIEPLDKIDRDTAEEVVKQLNDTDGIITTKLTITAEKGVNPELATECVAHVIKEAKLTHLTIDSCVGGAKNFRLIADALRENKELKYLDLSGNKLSNEQVKELAGALKINTRLVTLILKHINLTDDGCDSLAAMLDINKSLSVLNISDNGFHYIKNAGNILNTLEHNNTTISQIILGNSGWDEELGKYVHSGRSTGWNNTIVKNALNYLTENASEFDKGYDGRISNLKEVEVYGKSKKIPCSPKLFYEIFDKANKLFVATGLAANKVDTSPFNGINSVIESGYILPKSTVDYMLDKIYDFGFANFLTLNRVCKSPENTIFGQLPRVILKQIFEYVGEIIIHTKNDHHTNVELDQDIVDNNNDMTSAELWDMLDREFQDIDNRDMELSGND